MMSIISTVVGGLFSLGGDYFESKREENKAKSKAKLIEIEAEANTKLAISEAKINLAKQGQLNDYNLDMQSQKNMEKSWKDEFILLIFMTPIILCFIPEYSDIVDKGFKVLESSVPDWYVLIIVGMVVVIYGMRDLLKTALTFLAHKIKGK